MHDRGPIADLLVLWRARLHPDAVGLPATSAKVPELRRDEVAVLAGISVDYLTRLEQGRARHPSTEVVLALSRALRLSERERGQLFSAAALPVPAPALASTQVPPSVQRLLLRSTDVAIGVYTAAWTLLSANHAWRALLGTPPPDFNLIEAHFTGSAPRALMSPEYFARFERALVTDMREAALRYPDDPAVQSLLTRLRRDARFDRIWQENTAVQQRSERKTFDHPLVGPVTVDCDVFTAVGVDLRVIVYTAEPGSEDADRFDRLLRGARAGRTDHAAGGRAGARRSAARAGGRLVATSEADSGADPS